jgi:hypothetical protein
MDELEKRVLKIESWKNGNGARGAEVRLQDVENDVLELKGKCVTYMTDEATEKMVQAAFRGFVAAAQNKDKTAVAKIKAFAPYFATIGAIATALLTVLK